MKPERRLPVTPLTLEVVREPAHLEYLKPEWKRFAATMEGVTPFQLPEWQLVWWRHFGAGSLHLLLFRSMDTLVGALPLYLNEQNFGLIGAGVTTWLAPPILKTRFSEVLTLLKGHLMGNHLWRTFSLRNLPPSHPLLALNLGDGFKTEAAPDADCAALLVSGTFQAFWEGRPFALRRNFLKYLDKAAYPDRPRFEGVAQADPEFVNAAIRLGGAPFSAAKEGEAAFLSDLARALDDADMLRIFGLRFQGKLVAVLLAFVYQGSLYDLAGGHDPEFEAQGFGRLLLFECLRHAFEQGYRAWNFLGGDEPYKLLWGAQKISTAQLSIRREGRGGVSLQSDEL